MQTFLPYPSYAESARVLDNKRLGKQRVECKQILRALGVRVGGGPAAGKGWRHHPAVLMWKGHEVHLLMYAMAVCREWASRGFKDSLWWEFFAAAARCAFSMPTTRPSWLGDHSFHESHRSNLLRKDPVHYARFGWGVSPDLPYVWPAAKEDSHAVS